MSTIITRRMAEKSYDIGHSFFQQGRHDEALIELHRAVDTFRNLDTQGQVFSIPLSSGVSGLANASALSGLCYEKLGDYRTALTCYETSLINAKFEKEQSFLVFSRKFSQNIVHGQETDSLRPGCHLRHLDYLRAHRCGYADLQVIIP